MLLLYNRRTRLGSDFKEWDWGNRLVTTLALLGKRALGLLDWVNGTGAAGGEVRALWQTDQSQMHAIMAY